MKKFLLTLFSTLILFMPITMHGDETVNTKDFMYYGEGYTIIFTTGVTAFNLYKEYGVHAIISVENKTVYLLEIKGQKEI